MEPSHPLVIADPATATLRRAVSSLRTVGTVFLLLGALAALAIWHDGTRAPGALPFVATASLLWVGPGVLYHLTAHLFRRRDFGVARLAQWTAIGQTLLAIATIAVRYVVGTTASRHLWLPALPATATIFFAPALLVQARHIRTAAASLRLRARTHGFEVRPACPVLPLGVIEGDRERFVVVSPSDPGQP